MKKPLILILLLFSTSAYSQKLTKQLADSICMCFEEKIEHTAAENLRDSLIKCTADFAAIHSMALFEEYELEGFTVENIRFIQSKLKARLERKCKVIRALEN